MCSFGFCIRFTAVTQTHNAHRTQTVLCWSDFLPNVGKFPIMDKFVCFQQWVQITPRVFYQVGLGDAALGVMGTEGWGQMSQVGTNDGHRCPRWVQRDGHRGMCTDVPDGHRCPRRTQRDGQRYPRWTQREAGSRLQSLWLHFHLLAFLILISSSNTSIWFWDVVQGHHLSQTLQWCVATFTLLLPHLAAQILLVHLSFLLPTSSSQNLEKLG